MLQHAFEASTAGLTMCAGSQLGCVWQRLNVHGVVNAVMHTRHVAGAQDDGSDSTHVRQVLASLSVVQQAMSERLHCTY